VGGGGFKVQFCGSIPCKLDPKSSFVVLIPVNFEHHFCQGNCKINPVLLSSLCPLILSPEALLPTPSPAALGPVGHSKMDYIRRTKKILMTSAKSDQT
jgi:hypothetical protein